MNNYSEAHLTKDIKMRVAIAGASGYAGGELLRLIAGHPDLKLTLATADSSAGKAVAEVHANLAGQADLGQVTFRPHEAVAEAACDLVFLALPSGQSARIAAMIPPDVKVVDLGPDFRLADPAAWARHYGGVYAGRWVTGLPELAGARERISGADRVAAPGCFATAAILALAPLVADGLVEPGDVIVVAASGTSGAGRSLRTDLLGSEVMGSVSAYQVGGAHRHTPEIEQALSESLGEQSLGEQARGEQARGEQSRGEQARGEQALSEARDEQARAESPNESLGRDGAVRVSFTPMLAPMPRGILATASARLASSALDSAALRASLARAYDDEPFVRLLPDGRWPATAAVAGSNGAHLQVAADARSGRATVVSAIDNLGKGAAGQAVQLANLMLGLLETAGLSCIGVAP
jgi:N-acetyl-gamma-glutamyl-phosphate reductase